MAISFYFVDQVNPSGLVPDLFLAKNKLGIRVCTDVVTANGKPEDYKMFAELKVEDTKGSSDFLNTLIKQRLKPDETGCDTWNIESFLQDCLGCDCPPFTTEDNGVFQHTEAIRKFRICLTEEYTTSPEFPDPPFNVAITYDFTAINGGVDEKHLSVSKWKELFQDKTKVLSWFPGTKTITKCQHDWLTFVITNENITEVVMKLSLDGGPAVAISAPNPVQQNCMYSFPAGLCQLSLADAQHYSIVICDQDGNELFSRDYLVICHRKHYTYFLFCNSLGGLETIHFEGKKTTVPNFSANLYTDFDKIKKTKSKMTCRYLLNTGYNLDHCRMWFYMEFFNSPMLKTINFFPEGDILEERNCNCDCKPSCRFGWYCEVHTPPGDFTTMVDFEHVPERQFEFIESAKKSVFTPPFGKGEKANYPIPFYCKRVTVEVQATVTLEDELCFRLLNSECFDFFAAGTDILYINPQTDLVCVPNNGEPGTVFFGAVCENENGNTVILAIKVNYVSVAQYDIFQVDLFGQNPVFLAQIRNQSVVNGAYPELICCDAGGTPNKKVENPFKTKVNPK